MTNSKFEVTIGLSRTHRTHVYYARRIGTTWLRVGHKAYLDMVKAGATEVASDKGLPQ